MQLLNAKQEMSNITTLAPPPPLSLAIIRDTCGLPNYDAIRQVWRSLFGNLENWDTKAEALHHTDALALLQRMAQPYPNRPATVVDGATQLLTTYFPDFVPTPVDPLDQLDAKVIAAVAMHPSVVAPPRPRQRSKPRASTGPPAVGPGPGSAMYAPGPAPASLGDRLGAALDWVLRYETINLLSVGFLAWGAWEFLQGLGLFVVACFSIVLYRTLKAARRKSSWRERGWGFAALVVLEGAGGILHFAWANVLVWRVYDRLPWHDFEQVKQRVGDQVTLLEVDRAPGTVAVWVAIFVVALCIFAVYQVINAMQDTNDQAEYELAHGKPATN